MAKSESAPQDEPQDDTKRKFREALERKKANSAGAAARAEGVGNQAHAHGPAAQRRTFRRKSGG
ncbi:DUF5302 domain-containing protein [Mycolicibacterium sp.]|jgi:hypothetical protein|uniref:DUF5302 domain-containing protein n=1 Tax=Mycolicibacterium sp. TaxID=2320850 RepID=UPI0028A7204B|nr:DUF5302 domain-containing protein [Mycolicibacterium sp.]